MPKGRAHQRSFFFIINHGGCCTHPRVPMAKENPSFEILPARVGPTPPPHPPLDSLSTFPATMRPSPHRPSSCSHSRNNIYNKNIPVLVPVLLDYLHRVSMHDTLGDCLLRMAIKDTAVVNTAVVNCSLQIIGVLQHQLTSVTVARRSNEIYLEDR